MPNLEPLLDCACRFLLLQKGLFSQNTAQLFAARLQKVCGSLAADFICMVKIHCRNLAANLPQPCSRLVAGLQQTSPQAVFLVRVAQSIVKCHLGLVEDVLR